METTETNNNQIPENNNSPKKTNKKKIIIIVEIILLIALIAGIFVPWVINNKKEKEAEKKKAVENSGALVASGELITKVGIELDDAALAKGFSITDGSKGKIKITENKVKYDEAGVYQIKAVIEGRDDAWATQKVFVVEPATKGSTYIDVDISMQVLVFYQEGEIALLSEVVTGTPGTENETPTGDFSVFNKATDSTLIGPDYEEHVDYWIGFIGHEYGFHDRQSRTEWGGDVYKRDGSHGCVNMPLEKVSKLYELVSEGMPVFVHE